MQVLPTPLDGVMIIEPDIYTDERGFFMETFHFQRYQKAGLDVGFVQDNISFSVKGTLRGLHYQYPNTQAKLVQVIQGEIFDVVVDIRHESPTFGCSFTIHLDDHKKRQLFIPKGFAHGFCVLSDTALFAYKCSDWYSPDCEGGILWSDPDIGIDWPHKNPVLSEKDRHLPCLRDVVFERLPPFMPLG